MGIAEVYVLWRAEFTSYSWSSNKNLMFATKDPILRISRQMQSWVIIFGPKVGQIGTKWDKSGTSEDSFSEYFGSVSQNVRKFSSNDQVLSHLVPISPTWGSNLTTQMQSYLTVQAALSASVQHFM